MGVKEQTVTNHSGALAAVVGLAIPVVVTAQSVPPAQGAPAAIPPPAIAPVPTSDHFLPKIGGRFQLRYVINHRRGLPEDAENLATGFQLNRARLNFRGNAPADFTYFAEIDFPRATGEPVLLDFFAERVFGDAWRLRVGQFVIPLLRERGVPDSMQLAVERSIVNDVFEPGYAQGLMLAREWDAVRFSASFTDGLRSRATDFDSPWEADWALTGRGEVRFGSDWARFRDFTSWREQDFAALLGGAVHVQSGGDTFATVDVDVFQYTADLSVKGSGWNAFTAFIGRRTETPDVAFDDFGFVAQAGFFVTEQTELFGRYDIVMPDADRLAGDEFSTITLGANHYIVPRSHAAKLSGDVVFFLDRQSESASLVLPSTAQGVLPSEERGQFAVRLQMQLVF